MYILYIVTIHGEKKAWGGNKITLDVALKQAHKFLGTWWVQATIIEKV